MKVKKPIDMSKLNMALSLLEDFDAEYPYQLHVTKAIRFLVAAIEKLEEMAIG